MAASLVNSASNLAGNDTGAVDTAFTGDVVAGDLIIIIAWGRAGGGDVAYTAGMVTQAAGTATIGTVVLNAAAVSLEPNANSYPAAVWSVPVTATGTLTIRISHATWSAGSTRSYVALQEWSGMDISDTREADDAALTQSNVTSVSSGNVVTGAAGVIVGVFASGGDGAGMTITPDAAFTQIGELEQNDGGGSIIYQSVESDTTDAADWATSIGTYPAVVAVAFKEQAAGGPTVGEMMSAVGSVGSAAPRQLTRIRASGMRPPNLLNK